MNDFKKKLKEQGQRYFSEQTPDIDFQGKLDFKQTSTPNMGVKRRVKPIVFQLATIVGAIVFSLTAGAIMLQRDVPLRDPRDYGLAQIRSVDELRDMINAANERQSGGYYNDVATGSSETGMPEADGEGESTSHSETNVQVEGVDEGDIIKTDGDRIYKITYNRLQVIDVLADGQMDLLLDESMNSETDVNQYTYFSDIYITDDYLVVIGQRYTYFSYEYRDDSDNEGSDIAEPAVGWGYYYFGFPQTIAIIYDIETLTLEHEIEINGYILSSRRIDNKLYVISNHYPIMLDDDDDPRPVFRLDEEIIVPDVSEIKYLEDMPTQTFTIITTIFLDEIVDLEFDIYLGSQSWGTIYVSHNAIYLASYNYEYIALTQTYINYGILISYQFEDDGTVTFGGAVKYDGCVINQFAMDEYDGHMRLVTTEGWGSSVKNRLYVFKREVIDEKRVLTLVALIDEGIGKPGETVRSVRFNQDVATIVTYEQTDPLYTIDLSDPNNPVIRAGLEVTGYATYQHTWAPNLIIGIGYEAEGNAVFGLKLTLFDISDIDNPVVVGDPLVLWSDDYGWQWSEALYNHKAILIDHTNDILGFAISSYTYVSSPWDYRYYYYNDYYVFNIDPTSLTPITIETTISHDQFISDRDDAQEYYDFYYYASIDRAVTVGDYLFALSNLGATSHHISDDYTQADAIDLLIDRTPTYIL
jgi:uncharacterized secreted protein with C-terminal beta-propeller domain